MILLYKVQKKKVMEGGRETGLEREARERGRETSLVSA